MADPGDPGAALDAAWHDRWPAVRPIGDELRGGAAATWVRFHSLPDAQRYADTDAEYDELLRRHLTVLRELGAAAGTLSVISVSWSGSAEPVPREADLTAVFPPSVHWKSVLRDDSIPDEPIWTHLYLGTTTVGAQALRDLLRLVADDGAAGVILCPAGAEWLYHPYDGGADVIAPDRVTRDRLRSAHAGWLSPYPGGL